jgi:hypothetical protein
MIIILSIGNQILKIIIIIVKLGIIMKIKATQSLEKHGSTTNT